MASTVDVVVVDVAALVAVAVVVDVAADLVVVVAVDVAVVVVVDVVIIPLQFFCFIYHGCTPIGMGGPLL